MNALLIFLFFLSAQTDTLTANVTKVRDGDTIEVLLHNGKILPIRLHGVDSPDKCQANYEEAKRFTKESLLNKTIKFLQTGEDQYKRAVGEIFVDAQNTSGEYGVWFNVAIVAAGYAWHWPRYSNSAKLASVQVTAKTLRAGLWKDKAPMPPWEFRKTEIYKTCNLNY